MRKQQYFQALTAISTIFFLLFVSMPAFAKDPQLVPRRLSSSGDSMSLGGDAEYYGANVNASWVNGYYGYWQWLNGYTNVNSHNQRISAIWGTVGRKNFVNAVGGAAMHDFPPQAMRAVKQKAQYVTVLMGHNDVCQTQAWMIPSDEDYERNFRLGMDVLKNGLPAGATIYVVGIADLKRLWTVAQDKQALGIVNCVRIWSLDRFPCSTVVDPDNTEVDRLYIQTRNVAFNDILRRVTAEYEAADTHHYYFFSDVLFLYDFTEQEVSDLDCFHPSALGQTNIAEITWSDGPFKQYR